jgi:hypothetical protein
MVLFLVGALPIIAVSSGVLMRRRPGLGALGITMTLCVLAGAFVASWIDGEPNIGFFLLLFFPLIPVGGAAMLLAYVGRRRRGGLARWNKAGKHGRSE